MQKSPECAYALFNDKVIDAQQAGDHPKTAQTVFEIRSECAKCPARLYVRIQRGRITKGSRNVPAQCKDL